MSWARRTQISDAWWSEFEGKLRRQVSKQELVDWLSRKTWDAFHTGTFRFPASPAYVQKSFSRFLAAPPWHSIVRAALWVSEPHPGGHGFHSHALISFASHVRSRLFTQFSRSSGGPCSTRGRRRTGDRSADYSDVWRQIYVPWKESWWKYWGKATLHPIRNQEAMLSRYVMKYVLKAQDEAETGRVPPPWDRRGRDAQDTDWGIILR